MTARPADHCRLCDAVRLALVAIALALLFPRAAAAQQSAAATHPFLGAPIWVYNNWSAYDELSDEVPLTEALAMRELREVVRLRQAGIRLDYYVMDAFWYDPDGGYRRWREADWPQGPDAWLAACAENGLKPGLWFGTNSLVGLRPAAAWRDSLTADGTAMALYAGGFLPDFMDVLQYWYGRGVRLFKLDFAQFDAAVAGDETDLAPREIRRRNRAALYEALQAFRRRNPDVVLVGFNGFVGDVASAAGHIPRSILHWLDVFDSLYAGDPRPANSPQRDFWRSMDIYSDRMVRHYEQSGVPLSRIDSTGFMIGNTGTNYSRRIGGWRGMLLLLVARGGWINTVHGNLELLDDEKVRWFAKVQRLYDPLQRDGLTKSFGGSAGGNQPYGFGSVVRDGALYAVVNPAQRERSIDLPELSPEQKPNADGRVLFRDPGFDPVLSGNSIRLGPGQLALVGYGAYADPRNDLGIGRRIRIPRRITPIPARFVSLGGGTAIETEIDPPPSGDLRIVMQQRDEAGHRTRSFSRGKMGEYFTISATQDGKALPVETSHNRVIWSGLSWAFGEIAHGDLVSGTPVRIRLTHAGSDLSLHLDARLYAVEY